MRVTERHGITALTLEAAAQEAGLTKPGLMYHFRTRDELLMAIQRHLTETWEQIWGTMAVLGAALGPPSRLAVLPMPIRRCRAGCSAATGRSVRGSRPHPAHQAFTIPGTSPGHDDGPAAAPPPGPRRLLRPGRAGGGGGTRGRRPRPPGSWTW